MNIHWRQCLGKLAAGNDEVDGVDGVVFVAAGVSDGLLGLGFACDAFGARHDGEFSCCFWLYGD